MPRFMLMDVIHVNTFVPSRLPDAAANAMRRTLHRPQFMGRLRRAVCSVFREHAALAKVRIALTR